jgi:1,4-dihydroxy-2-naphthoate octaprenyltransferase
MQTTLAGHELPSEKISGIISSCIHVIMICKAHQHPQRCSSLHGLALVHTAAHPPSKPIHKVLNGRSGESWSSLELLRAVFLGLTVQAASNTGNTYWDFVNGADTSTVGCGADADKVLKHKGVLVEGKTDPQSVFIFTMLLYAASAALMADRILASTTILGVYVAGVLLSHFYTANPIRLKYYALGDIAIFIAFGPLLTLCTVLLVSPSAAARSEIVAEVWGLTVPCQLICECILHANNSRDIFEDRKNGLTTLATLLGFDNSKRLFVGMILGAYACACTFGWKRGSASMFLVLVTIPLAWDVVSRFCRDANRMADLPKRVAKLHLAFGLCMIAGVLMS